VVVARSTLAYGTSAVVVRYCGIVVVRYRGIVVYCGGNGCYLRLRCVCGAPAVPLPCAYSVVAVCSDGRLAVCGRQAVCGGLAVCGRRVVCGRLFVW
jgi:hypothetical protein